MVPERTLATLTIRLAAGRSAGARKDGGDMPREIHGQLTVDGQRFAIVVSRFNEFITSKLLSGAIDALTRHGGDELSFPGRNAIGGEGIGERLEKIGLVGLYRPEPMPPFFLIFRDKSR
jgi:hypothetical protein